MLPESALEPNCLTMYVYPKGRRVKWELCYIYSSATFDLVCEGIEPSARDALTKVKRRLRYYKGVLQKRKTAFLKTVK